MAFTALNPLETEEVGRRLAARHGAAPEALAADVGYDIGTAEVEANLALALAIERQLAADGLGGWSTGHSHPEAG